MTRDQFSMFLTVVIAMCAGGAFLNLGKAKSRGTSAYLLCAAFLTLGLAAWFMRGNQSNALIGFAIAATMALLLADAIVRIRRKPVGRNR